MACDLVLHLGAHRTGSSLLQHFVSCNFDFLQGCGIHALIPPATRTGLLGDIVLPEGRLLISEENLIGTMATNLETGLLYPRLQESLGEYPHLLAGCKRAMITVRNPVDYWPSVIAFRSVRGSEMPDRGFMKKVAIARRSWRDVVMDLRMVLPKAEIVVREFHWALDRPRQQLRQASHWDDIGQAMPVRKAVNRRPTGEQIRSVMHAEGRSDKGEPLDVPDFDAGAKRRLCRQYLQDLQEIRQMSNLRLLSEPLADLRQRWDV